MVVLRFHIAVPFRTVEFLSLIMLIARTRSTDYSRPLRNERCACIVCANLLRSGVRRRT